jgi:hypothetical protein
MRIVSHKRFLSGIYDNVQLYLRVESIPPGGEIEIGVKPIAPRGLGIGGEFLFKWASRSQFESLYAATYIHSLNINNAG